MSPTVRRGRQRQVRTGRRVTELVERCAVLAGEVAALRLENDRLRQRVHELEALEAEVARLQDLLEAAQAAIKQYAHMLFGRKSERGPLAGASAVTDSQNTAEAPCPEVPVAPPPVEKRRPRGQVPGRPGHGRRLGQGLPVVERLLTLAEADLRCARCGAPYEPMPGAVAPSHVLDWWVHVIVDRYLRQKYRRTCDCPDAPGIRIAPPPNKVVAKGGFSAQFIARLCLEKFALARPLHKVVQSLAWQGVDLSAGTLTGVLHEIAPLLQPLYQAICQRVRASERNQGDETSYTMLDDEQQPHRWWLWIVTATDAVAFLLDPHRSADVLRRFFGWLDRTPPAKPERNLLTDCFPAYKTLVPWITQAFCWAHLRRRFRDAARKAPKPPVIAWAGAWGARIHQLYPLHRARRRAQPDSAAWRAADQALRQQIGEMEHVLQDELRSGQLHPQQQAVLEHFQRHWAGYVRFLDDPALPLDNNWVERLLRIAVLGRKNFNFLGAVWAGQLAAMLWSIFATARANGLNPLSYLTAYLQACAEAGGRPLDGAALERFLPWNLTEADRTAWSAPLALPRSAPHPQGTPIADRRTVASAPVPRPAAEVDSS